MEKNNFEFGSIEKRKPDNIKDADLSPLEEQEIERYKQEAERAKEELARYKQDTKERKTLSKWVRCIVPVWLGFTATSFLLNGYGCISVSESVMITLLGTTTANVLGLGYILLKGLFPEEKIKK